MVVFAPCTVQEMYEMTVQAFNVADKYRVVSMIMGDGMLGQMMEVVEFKDKEEIIEISKNWAATGTKMERENNVITSIFLEPEVLETLNLDLQRKYAEIEEHETMVETINCEEADIILVAYGTVSRIVKDVIVLAQQYGIKVGLIRPKTLWPFPDKEFKKYQDVPKAFLCVELSAGQMVEDVRLALEGKNKVHFYGRMGGMVPSQKEIFEKIRQVLGCQTEEATRDDI